MSDTTLRAKLASGITWNSVAQLTNRVFQFGVTIILARLLTPKDFGVYGMALVFIGLVSAINDIGLGAAVVQKKDISQREKSTIFWIVIFVGLLLTIVSVFSSPFVANFFDNDDLKLIITVLSANFLIGSAGVIPVSLLAKEIRFKKLAVVNILSSTAYGVSAISLALAGFGVWSLVVSSIILTTTKSVSYWVINKWRPDFVFRFSEIRGQILFGIKILGTNIVNYLRGNIDYFFVGKFLGPEALGIYTIAFKIADFARNRLIGIVNGVLFPALSTVQDETEILRKEFLNTIKLVSMATFPFLIGIIAVAPEFIGIIYGHKWMDAVVPLQILCFMGILATIYETTKPLLMAKNRAGMLLISMAIYSVVLSGLVYFALPHGIVGVSFAVAIASIVYSAMTGIIARRILQLKWTQFLAAFKTSTIGSASILVFIYFYRLFSNNWLDNYKLVWFISAIFLTICMYLYLTAFILKDKDSKKVLDKLLKPIKYLFASGHSG